MAKRRKQIELYLTASVPEGTTMKQARHELKQRVNAPGWEHEEVRLKALAVVPNPHEQELLKLAEMVGDKSDPFAVWEGIEALRRGLQKAASKFREYEDLHYKKGTEEGNLKGLANGLIAQEIEALLKPMQDPL